MKRKIALFSVYNTEGVTELASGLIKMGWKIVATEETVRELKMKSLPVESIEEFVNMPSNVYNFPPTLNPKVEACLTQERLSERIDLVYDIPYPLIIGNDVGGHTLIALAIKGNRIPVMSKDDMERVINDIKNKGDVSEGLKRRLQEKAIRSIIAHYQELLGLSTENDKYCLCGHRHEELLNGENPYQVPAYSYIDEYKSGDLIGISDFIKLSGEPPCFTNLADFDSLLRVLHKLSLAFYKYYNKIPYISIASKHGNPCGLCVDWKNPLTTIENALWGNPLAIWGGEFMMNFKVDSEIADLLLSSPERKKVLGNANWMLDLVVASDFKKDAIRKLGVRNKRKLYNNILLGDRKNIGSFKNTFNLRKVINGFLLQPENSYVLDFSDIKWNMEEGLAKNINNYLLSWVTAYQSFHGGNEVAISVDSKLIGVGGGPSTFEAAKMAVRRAQENKHDLTSAIFAADAFFPHVDAIQVLIGAGCKGGIAPGGGINERVTNDMLKEKKLIFGSIPGEFRGFCRH